MKIGVISDTHNRLAGIDGAFAIFNKYNVKLIIHCGDWTTPDTASYFADAAKKHAILTKGVLGNNDLKVSDFLALPAENNTISHFALTEGVMSFTVDGRSFAVYHGHHKPTLRSVLARNVDVLCLGHSHKPRYDRIDTKIIINPGSTAFSIPRSKTWRPSVAVYDTVEHEVEFIYF